MSQQRAALVLFFAASASAQPFTISTVVGGSPAPTPAAAASYNIRSPYGLVPDPAGNLYFTTTFNCIFKLSAGGALSIVAGCATGYSGDGGPAVNARLQGPSGLALDAQGNLFVADTSNHVIRRISAAGIITTVAGVGSPGSSGDGGPAAKAQLQYPTGVAADSAGNLYIADSANNRVRKVSAAGVITTIAGTGDASFNGDGGPAASAALNDPFGVAVDASGNVLIADYMNSRIRKVSANGTITTVVGAGQRFFDGTAFGDLGPYLGDGGPATSAIVDTLNITVDSAGNLLVTDSTNNRIRKVDSKGVITTLAGSSRLSKPPFGDGGPATSATLYVPWSAAADASGNVYIADQGDQIIRKVSPTGTINTVAGAGSVSYAGDGGPAKYGVLNSPFGLTIDAAGNLNIADTGNNVIRKITRAGVISTLALPAGTSLVGPTAVLSAADGSLYISDTGQNRILKVSSGGVVSVVAGASSGGGYNGDNIGAASALLSGPQGLALDRAGNLYVAEYNGARIRKIDTTGTITTVAGTGQSGNVTNGVPATSSPIYLAMGVGVDSTGNLYIGEYMGRLLRVGPDGIMTTAAGKTFGPGDVVGDGGPGTSAYLRYFNGWLAIDSADNVYLSEGPPSGYDSYGDGNNRIRKVSKQGVITTVAGYGPAGYTGDGGLATAAAINQPLGITLDAAGNLYFVDQGNFLGSSFFRQVSVVRMLTPASPPAISTAGALPSGNVGTTYSVTLTASAGAPPYTWSVISGSLPAGLKLSTAGVIAGTPSAVGTFQFTIQATDSASLTASLAFTLKIANNPVIDSVQQGAKFTPGAVVPGEFLTVFAENLGSTDQIAPVFPATVSQGISVLFNGKAAPLYNVIASNHQINLIVPSELPYSGTVSIVVQTSAGASAPLAAPLASADVGIFQLADPATPSRNAAAMRFSSKAWYVMPASTAAAYGLPPCTGLSAVANCGQPAAPGDYVDIYLTGLGLATPKGDPNGPTLPTGQVAPADGSVLYLTVAQATATIGGIAATPLFSGIAPGTAGEYQITLQVPAGVPIGDDIPLTVTLPGTTHTRTIAIHN